MKITTISAPTMGALSARLDGLHPDFVSVHLNSALGKDGLDAGLPAGTALHGATSCLGAMSDAGVHDGVAAFVIEDPAGSYVSVARPYGDDPRAAAGAAVSEALHRADRVGERPELVWISATPGVEEAVIAGIESVTGPDVPIIGGSAADNSVSGEWFVFDGGAAVAAGVVVSVLFPSTAVSFAYQSGYSPTARSGTVTRASGRVLHEIDHRPAMEVYAEWTGDAVAGASDPAGSAAILSDSTLWPLGRQVTELHGVPFYLLAHPATAHGSGDIELFATVEQGETLTQMSGTATSLVERAGRVAALARRLGPDRERPLAGALMIYCGGCMLRVRSDLDVVVRGVEEALDGAPFLGAFTFGEQGTLVGAGNRHGNLMISCIVFEAE